MSSEPSDSLIYDATLKQLERMRAMQYAYHQKFFHWIFGTFLLLLILLLLPNQKGFYLLPFIVVTCGIQAAFYLHFCDFARVHSQHLEHKINQLFGRKILLGEELEHLYFYPRGGSKLVGLLPQQPTRFFNIYTLHWVTLWAFLFLLGLHHVYTTSPFLHFLIYTSSALLWALLNAGYLLWYFGQGRDLQSVSHYLEKNLHQPL
jgi:hypothetical protein